LSWSIDWEAIADRAPDELFSPQSLPEVSRLSLKDSEMQVPKRRGRGTFTYKKQGLYSDQQTDESVSYDSPDEVVNDKPENVPEGRNCELNVDLMLYFYPVCVLTCIMKVLLLYGYCGLLA